MQVAVIGTGNVGRALGSSLTRAGHHVTFAARDAEQTRRVAAEVGATVAASPGDAAAAADVVVLAVPYGAAQDVASKIAGSAAGKIVIDVTNPLTPDYSGLATAGGPSAAEQFAIALPGASVAKAFNTLFASIIASPGVHGQALDVLFATDDDRARNVLRDLITSIGFRAVDAGPLAAAREIEALAWLNIRLQLANNGTWDTAVVLVGAPAAATTELAAAAR